MEKDTIYSIHQMRTILRESRNCRSLEELQQKLKQHKIEMRIEKTLGTVTGLGFKKNHFSFSPTRGRNQIITEFIQRRVLENARQHRLEKEKERASQPKYNRFEEIRRNRELKTSLERQDMFNTRNLSR